MGKIRITAIFETDLGNKIIATAKEQKRSKSAMLTIMAEDWYKTPVLDICGHLFKDMTVFEENPVEQCVKCGLKRSKA